MPRVHVSVGSNIDRECNIRSAVGALRRQFGTLSLSPVYQSESVGFEADDFYNLVVGFDTNLRLEDVARRLAEIETVHGRVRNADKFSSRTLDLDILLFGDLVDHTPPNDIPRGEITRYAFVLKPLSDIAGPLRHPEIHQTFERLWRDTQHRLQPVRFVDMAW